jgi:FKBP12-rapamycin complex-associated protein
MELHDKMHNLPETMNEIHFHQLYSADLSDAENSIKRYIESKNELEIKQAWDIYQSIFTNIIDISKNVKYLDLENVSPKLYNFKESQICIPGLYKSGYPVIKIRGFEKQLTVLSSKQHPRRLIIYGSDEKDYMFLLKGHEDLRQDERAMQLFGLVNTLLANDTDTADKNLFIKRFPVIPLSHNTGIIGWVPNCDTLYQLIREYRISNKIIEKVEYKIVFTIYPKFETGPFMNKLEVFKYALQNTMGLDLYKILWKKSKNSEAWLDRRTNYSRSLAVMSMVGYILGLGDRHPSNLMLDRNSGKIIHIDFGDCFEVAMKREKHPERVPFRLTRMLIKALEVSGIEGTFRMTCDNVMRVLRSNKDSLIAILASFVHDPLISFRLLIPFILKSSRIKKGINQEGNYFNFYFIY